MARFGSIGSIQFTGLGKSGRRPPLGLFVALPTNSTGTLNPYTSNDNGATWTERTNPRAGGTVESYVRNVLNLGNGKIFALTYDYDTSFSYFDRQVSGYLTSTNGTTWTNAGTFPRSEIPAGQTRWNVYYHAAHNGKGTIVVMGGQAAVGSGSSYLKVSTDYGVNWTTVNFGGGTSYYLMDENGLQYVNNQFVALCRNTSATNNIRILTSTNGTNWTVITPSLGNSSDNYPLQVWAYDLINNRYVATRPQFAGDAHGSNKAAYSTNLTTWTDTTLTQYYNPWVTYGAGKFVVQGYFFQTIQNQNGDYIDQVQAVRDVEYSTNGGTSWQGTGRTVPGSVLPTGPGGGGVGQQGAYQKIEFAGGYFWAFGSTTTLSGDNVDRTAPTWVARSTDALTWTKLNGPLTTGLFDASIRYI
jgi:hypothetical protein